MGDAGLGGVAGRGGGQAAHKHRGGAARGLREAPPSVLGSRASILAQVTPAKVRLKPRTGWIKRP